MPNVITLDQLRCHALSRSLFVPTTLMRAVQRLGFVQADPIRAPARAQDLTLRQRVTGYRAGELERRYARLALEEDYFVNYGFLPRATQRLMHPRLARTVWTKARQAQAQAVLDFVRERGAVHPREVDAQFNHGKTRNWFGGTGNASTQLLDGMHYRGLLRVARRDSGTRVYAVRDADPVDIDDAAAHDALLDAVLNKYAPLPERSMSELASHLSGGVPQWRAQRGAALQRLLQRTPQTVVDGTRWLWPVGENPASRRHRLDEQLRLLAPFDPVVWDRRRFEAFWGWAYRFEAYTPAPQRVRGYYALPLLWRGRIDGWGNLTVTEGRLEASIGWQVGKPPPGDAWRPALEDELSRMAAFLELDAGAFSWKVQRR